MNQFNETDHGSPHRAPQRCPAPTSDEVSGPIVRSEGASSPTPTAALIAELSGQDVAAVKAALVGVRDAYRGGDIRVIEDALLEQAALLQALGAKLLGIAGNATALPRIQVFANLGLRALEGGRKALGTLAGMRHGPRKQTNVQVNVGGPTYDLFGAPNT